ncbi:trans-sialidase, putative [Trypanosoma cruzi]|uniref:Trans-sialidase, putative n=2 Tax=Trypanosoma cruzi TaxID=5693 RepID=Q4DQ09_TRYCC|nr:trans-sialidase, putative [Trypanosoma cruzi]EAN94608.1 trans-sialidase, putative [Trypanosoma cruzi]|eukprot:XP_816459.1 trans-sialidase [Trypanosoma cruzi strain CL Brener]
MLSRVAAVMAPRTHNRRRVTGSSGRRREGRESEPQRPNISRRVFTSAVLLLLVVVMMMCCSTGGGAQAAEVDQSSNPRFQWKDIKSEGGVTVDSLGVPGLLKVGSGVFVVAEAQCKKDGNSGFSGIVSQLLTETEDNEPKEVLKEAKKDTQVLEEVTSAKEEKRVNVSRPTAVVEGSNIYMLVGKHSHGDLAECKAGTEKIKSEILLVKGTVSGDEAEKKIRWNDTDGLPCTLGEEHKSLSQLILGGGSGVKMHDDTLVFPVEGKKKKEKEEKDVKTVSLILYSKDFTTWTLSKGMSADGCSVPSVVEWEKEKKLMMMTACDDGPRRVYESDDKGDSWTEALGTLSRVWGNKRDKKAKLVRSGFITARTDGVEDKRTVMLVTLPVYSKKEKNGNSNGKGVLHLWVTDNTHIVDIGPVSGDEDAAASSLLYRSGKDGKNKKELIALYEKKKGDEKETSPGMVSVILTEQLKRVKEVLKTWNEVDKRVSKLCASENAKEDPSPATACGAAIPTDGLVGFLSGKFSDGTWRDEYLGVNATVKKNDGVEKKENGVTFKGRGAWAEWPVGSQGENQLYHFANYNFTLVATVSIHGEPKGDTPISLMGVKTNGAENTVLLGLSYSNNEKKWMLLCGGGTKSEELSSPWEPGKKHQLAIVLQNGSQGSAYVDGQRLGGDEQCELKVTEPNEISHFYIGGDGGGAGSQEGVSVTVTNVLLYNRPLNEAEIVALKPNKDSTSPLEKNPSEHSTVSSTSIITPISPVSPNAQKTETPSTPVGTQLTEQGQSMGSSKGAGSGAASASAVSTVSNSSAGKESVVQVTSGTSPDGTQTVGGGSTAVGEPTMETREGGTNGQEEEVNQQVMEVNTTALNSSLGNVSQGNNSDAGTMRESGLLPSLLLLLLGLWWFAAL